MFDLKKFLDITRYLITGASIAGGLYEAFCGDLLGTVAYGAKAGFEFSLFTYAMKLEENRHETNI